MTGDSVSLRRLTALALTKYTMTSSERFLMFYFILIWLKILREPGSHMKVKMVIL